MARSIRRNLMANCSGASVVEFALISVPLFALIIGTVENILVSVARISLDSTLQAVVYDAANNMALANGSILSKNGFCDRTTFLLVDCNASKDLCFSVIQVDQLPIAQIMNVQCTQSISSVAARQGVFAYIVEYKIPNYLNFIPYIMPTLNGTPADIKIRSVALFQPV